MNCRSCGGSSFGDVIDLGLMPLVNNLLKTQDESCPRWPLKVVFCRACSLAQLTESPPPEMMFSEYLYFSSQSQTMVSHAGELVCRYVQPGQRVLEIASNDGYLLAQAQQRGAVVLGVDPARNIADVAIANSVPTQCDYFDKRMASTIRNDWGSADVIFANNVLAHVPDPNEIAAGIKTVLANKGIAHIEVPWIVRMLESGAFDTIYHEHQCYFSLTALRSLFRRHGLCIIHAEVIEIHGGSLHIQVAHQGDELTCEKLCDEEGRIGILEDRLYANFSRRVVQLRSNLGQALEGFDQVAGYGAAAKGIVLLNHFGLDVDHIPWVADVSPHKQGRFVPGTRQPIVPPEELLCRKPEAALLLPWNIKDEIVRRNAAFVNQGGRFIVPIPEVTIL